jgi:propanol-preferring alcohol dehydrogenase
LDAIVDTTPVWKPIVEALKNLAPGGRLVINAIRKEQIDQEELQRLDYPTHLCWKKRSKVWRISDGVMSANFLHWPQRFQ